MRWTNPIQFPYWFVFFFFLANSSLQAQNFGLLLESAFLKAQIDGDNLKGYNFSGYFVGIGSNISFKKSNYFAVKTSFYNQGSRNTAEYHTKIGNDIRLEIDMKSIGVELSYKYASPALAYFLGIGLVHHQIVFFDYNIIEIGNFSEREKLQDDDIIKSFNSAKFFIGYKFNKAFEAYVFSENALNGILEKKFYNIPTLIPYSYGIALSYQLTSLKNEKSSIQSTPRKKIKKRRF